MTLDNLIMNDRLAEESRTTRTIEKMLDYAVNDYKVEHELDDSDIDYRAIRVCILDDDKVTISIKGYEVDSCMYVESLNEWQNL